jgi:hypothetical protein
MEKIRRKHTFKLKKGHGVHYFKRTLSEKNKKTRLEPITAGKTVECYVEELGGALNKFECLTSVDPKAESEQYPETEQGLIAQRTGQGKYNVINQATGEKLNTEPLSKVAALEWADKGILPEGEEQTEGTTGGGPHADTKTPEPETA